MKLKQFKLFQISLLVLQPHVDSSHVKRVIKLKKRVVQGKRCGCIKLLITLEK